MTAKVKFAKRERVTVFLSKFQAQRLREAKAAGFNKSEIVSQALSKVNAFNTGSVIGLTNFLTSRINNKVEQ